VQRLFSTLKQDKYEIEVDPTTTVDKLKDLIEQHHKFEKSSQTLIYAGKILPNEKTIEECKIGAEDFLVLMVKKAAKPATATPAEKLAVTPATEKPESTSAVTATASGPESDAAKQGAEALVTGTELEKAIDSIADMGFPRDQVVVALRASFNNPDRAIEYLTNGIPPDLNIAPPTQATQARPQRPPTAGAQPQAPAGGSGAFDGLRQHPQFAQLCLLAQQGEESLKQILTYFAQTNRPLLDLIMANQEEFIRLLSSPVPGSAGGGAGFQGPAGVTPPGVIRVQVTPEDERVITNLVNMGFERNRVMEAYFLFEKDETLTANYLLNNPDFDDNGDTGSQWVHVLSHLHHQNLLLKTMDCTE